NLQFKSITIRNIADIAPDFHYTIIPCNTIYIGHVDTPPYSKRISAQDISSANCLSGQVRLFVPNPIGLVSKGNCGRFGYGAKVASIAFTQSLPSLYLPSNL